VSHANLHRGPCEKYIDEASLQYRTVWDLYIKFYTVYLTFNAAAFGLTVQYVTNPNARSIVCVLFILQNLISGTTAYKIAQFSLNIKRHSEELANLGAELAQEKLPKPIKDLAPIGATWLLGGIGNVNQPRHFDSPMGRRNCSSDGENSSKAFRVNTLKRN